MFEIEYNKQESLISGDRIRLLTLAASKDFTDPIRVSLSVASLSDKPEYEALSYCWGDPSDKVLIFSDDRPFPVTLNLESALRHLRRSHDERVLWVDAISINQEGLEERAHQVSLMGHIYESASRVVVWLGEASADSHLVFPLCEEMAASWASVLYNNSDELTDPINKWRKEGKKIYEEKWRETKKHQDSEAVKVVASSSRPRHKDHDGPVDEIDQDRSELPRYPTQEESVALSRLNGRPWFTRCWVIQEIALPRKAIMQCGADTITWYKFALGLAMSVDMEMFGRWGFSGHGLVDVVSTSILLTMDLRRYRHGYPSEAWGNATVKAGDQRKKEVKGQGDDETLYLAGDEMADKVDLQWLLWHARRLDATDPRDKVYSVLGLINQKEQNQMTTLAPDYNISVEECYRRAALAILSYRNNLDLLMTDHNPQCDLALPSWVPDWTHVKWDLPRQWDPDRDIEKAFCAGSPSWGECSIESRVKGHVLTISGYEFDEILELEDVLHLPDMDERVVDSRQLVGSVTAMKKFWKWGVYWLGTFYDTLSRWEKLALSREQRYPTGEEPITAYAMLLCLGFAENPEEASTLYQQWHKAIRGQKAVSLLRRLKSDDRSGGFHKSVAGLTGIFSSLASDNATDMVHVYATANIYNRRLARTRKGYLALVPGHSAVGDNVSLFRGAKLPLVTRAQKGMYQLIGPSLVYGIMHGEAWDPSLPRDMAFV
ncbi:heterokaryon incompatibility protein-domain-containing protein [Xylariaceae sp. FL1651]|nr:heterokaryon incompatibility protein-domain-containing protein [Xylariaceae sp. FL1651]